METFGLPPRVLPQSARRLREEPIDTALVLVEQFGERGATMLGEAQAAAYLDGRLRRAGLKVSADGFRAPTWRGWDGSLLAGLMLVGTALVWWQNMLAMCVTLLGFAWAVLGFVRAGNPLLVKRRSSQNIIGTRALAQQPKGRIVVLAPLDAARVLPPWMHAVYDGGRASVARVVVALLLVLLAASNLFAPVYIGIWLAQWVLCVMLLVLAGCDWWHRRAPVSPGAMNHAGALAVLLASAEELTAAQSLELWMVAIGANEYGSGFRDFLRRYPFEQTSTQFIVLESIGHGALGYVTRTGLLKQCPSDSELLRLAAAVDAEDSLIDAEPRIQRHAPTMLGALCGRGWRAIGISCFETSGAPRASARDTVEQLDANVLDRAVRLVVGLVRAIDHA